MTRRTITDGRPRCENCGTRWPEKFLTSVDLPGCPECTPDRWANFVSRCTQQQDS